MSAKKSIYLLDDTLEVAIFYESKDRDLTDNICMVVNESCPEEEKVFKHDETHLYFTREQALALARAFISAVEQSESGTE